ncbi:hypothetical protein [Arthrobacter sp. A2-55]|uniref:hypothetical protein n=1 Tax=Arthrobacter sp. A2-55 TaxID=2897337 RepID=UPI0021CDDCA5|nr:hypothetical protein [Arthrobacter sp. A2-55]MCU6479084.1 hypothetical protein [Arthrobacter sp. A2-55]
MGTDNTPVQPQADTTLAALAVLGSFDTADFASVDVLMASTNPRELIVGLVDASRILIDILANATDTSTDEVIAHVRKQVLGLLNSGELGAEVSPY